MLCALVWAVFLLMPVTVNAISPDKDDVITAKDPTESAARPEPASPALKKRQTSTNTTFNTPAPATSLSPLSTAYYAPMTYTPLPTCTTTSFEYIITIPLSITALLNISDHDIFVSSTINMTIGTTTTPVLNIVLNPMAVDPDILSSASVRNEAPEISRCVEPGRTSVAPYVPTETASWRGVRCRDANPACEGCTWYIRYCNGNGCPPVSGGFYNCSGVIYEGAADREWRVALAGGGDVGCVGMSLDVLSGCVLCISPTV